MQTKKIRPIVKTKQLWQYYDVLDMAKTTGEEELKGQKKSKKELFLLDAGENQPPKKQKSAHQEIAGRIVYLRGGVIGKRPIKKTNLLILLAKPARGGGGGSGDGEGG